MAQKHNKNFFDNPDHSLFLLVPVIALILFWAVSVHGAWAGLEWEEGFDYFPNSNISIAEYGQYTPPATDYFVPYAYEDEGWRSNSNQVYSGAYSIIYDCESYNYPSFKWYAGNDFIGYEDWFQSGEGGWGSVYFKVYISENFDGNEFIFSLLGGEAGSLFPLFAKAGDSIPNTLFNYGAWNSVEINFGVWEDGFIQLYFINGFYDSTKRIETIPTFVTGMQFSFLKSSNWATNGYVLIDSIEMYGDRLEEEQYLYPFLSWENYYDENSDQFSTPTSIFGNMANSITSIVNRIGSFILYMGDYFDTEEASSKGEELGEAIPKARGYLEMIDDFIGSPLSALVVFYFLTLIVVFSYKLIFNIIKLIKP